LNGLMCTPSEELLRRKRSDCKKSNKFRRNFEKKYPYSVSSLAHRHIITPPRRVNLSGKARTAGKAKT